VGGSGDVILVADEYAIIPLDIFGDEIARWWWSEDGQDLESKCMGVGVARATGEIDQGTNLLQGIQGCPWLDKAAFD
jgi:hypothetical protein